MDAIVNAEQRSAAMRELKRTRTGSKELSTYAGRQRMVKMTADQRSDIARLGALAKQQAWREARQAAAAESVSV